MTAVRCLREIFYGDPLARVVSPSLQADNDFGSFSSLVETRAVDADVVGDETFGAHDVPRIYASSFTHFLDGAQRSCPALYYGLHPVRLAHTSAALACRKNGRIDGLDEQAYQGGLTAFVPDAGDLCSRIENASDLHVIPVPVSEEETEGAVAERSQQLISEQRESREIESARLFCQGWLLVDGGIGRIWQAGDERQVVGVVKTHANQYFRSRERVLTVLNLREGQRTTVFHRKADPKQGAAVYSFYLRLRESRTESPFYGIVRIEIPPTETMLERVDEIAGWLLYERAPMSLPDPRYDRLLYPIRLVEQHLKARQPSEAALRAIIGI